MFNRIPPTIFVLAIGITAITFLRKPVAEPVSRPTPDRPDRLPTLRAIAGDQEKEAAKSVATYRPRSNARVDYLQSSADDLLRGLPGVVDVEAMVRAKNPTCRIIHLRDWHFVAHDL